MAPWIDWHKVAHHVQNWFYLPISTGGPTFGWWNKSALLQCNFKTLVWIVHWSLLSSAISDEIVLDSYSTGAAKRYMKKVRLTDPEREVYECSICQMQTNYIQSMYRHFATKHTAPKQYYCPNCCKEFTNSVYLRKHLLSCVRDQQQFYASMNTESTENQIE